MPTYEFRLPDGTIVEKVFRMSEVPDEIPNPNGEGRAVRIISGGAALVFKGSGFYLTDYGRNAHRTQGDAKPSGGSDSPSDGASAKSESGAAKSSDGKASEPKASDSKSSESKSSDAKSSASKPAESKSSEPKPSSGGSKPSGSGPAAP
jgi:predicted nucleic acid-binding Zn ribbon protein